MKNTVLASPSERKALDAAVAALSAPQPPAEAQDKWKALIGKWQQRAEAAGYDGIEGALEAAEAQAQGGGDVCEVCDGGPGNDGPCLCGLNAPPSAPAGMERFDAWFDEYTKNNYTDEMLAEAAWKAALAQQPAAVDGAMVERATMTLLGKTHDALPGVDWRCDKSWTVNRVRELMRRALTAALAAQPGGSDNDR